MDRLVSRIQGFLLRPVTRPVAWPRAPDWHRDAVGGMWDEIGQLQFKFLVDQGLQPGHRLLDVGCGSLRGGVHFARYLDSGNYFGVDIDQALLDAGRLELERYHLIAKKVTLAQTDSFDFQSLQQKFDYALAQSVFTHLPLNSIIRCVLNMEPVLVRGGRFYATFFENPKGKFHLAPSSHPFSSSKWDGITYFDQDPYHYSFETFEWIVEGANLTVEYRGDWGHPNDQRMMVFTKTC
jgi:SAM-dependent methyltransferase